MLASSSQRSRPVIDRQAECDALGLVQWEHCAHLAAGGELSGGGGLGGSDGLQARICDLDFVQVKQKLSRHAGAY